MYKSLRKYTEWFKKKMYINTTGLEIIATIENNP